MRKYVTNSYLPYEILSTLSTFLMLWKQKSITQLTIIICKRYLKAFRPLHLHDVICFIQVLNERKSLQPQEWGRQSIISKIWRELNQLVMTKQWVCGSTVSLNLLFMDHIVLFHLSFTITAIKPLLHYLFPNASAYIISFLFSNTFMLEEMASKRISWRKAQIFSL